MRVIIVDDDPIVAKSLSLILSVEADIEPIATGTRGDDAITLFEECLPDVLLMDIQMPGCDGLSAAEEILSRHPGARIVFLTTFSDDEYIVRALRLGTRGYLIKQDISTIAPALRSVMAGQVVLEGEVLERATTLGARRTSAGGTPQPEILSVEGALAPLTEREREVVRAVADGLDNREIADTLCLSAGTVRNHISSILAKLGLKNRTQIAVFFYRNCC
jgi:two component transcriptional regulator, luxR family